jgi:hypothetical protein
VLSMLIITYENDVRDAVLEISALVIGLIMSAVV